jgi:hypothetical protein
MYRTCTHTHAHTCTHTHTNTHSHTHTHARAHTHTHAHMCARVCAIGRACISAPTRASAFRRRGPRLARLAGVLLGVGVQRGQRRVEHRGRHHVGLGMRRLFGPGGAPPRAGRARLVFTAARAVAPTCCVRARARACAIGRPRIRADTCERLRSAWTAGGSARQAFSLAKAFNTNIGAWNTASITTLSGVCAGLFGPGGAPPQAGRARPGVRCGAGR